MSVVIVLPRPAFLTSLATRPEATEWFLLSVNAGLVTLEFCLGSEAALAFLASEEFAVALYVIPVSSVSCVSFRDPRKELFTSDQTLRRASYRIRRYCTCAVDPWWPCRDPESRNFLVERVVFRVVGAPVRLE